MKQKWIVLLFFSALILATGCDQSGNVSNETSAVPVEVMHVQSGRFVKSLFFNGDIAAEVQVNISSKIPDRIETYFVDEGDAVKAGMPVARVAATAIEQAERQAEAGLAAALAQEANMRSEYERAQRLKGENAISQQQFDAVKTQYEAVTAQVNQARAMLAAAKSQFSDATITSPIDGIIGRRFFEAGDMAAPGVPVASVVQMDRVKMVFEATERDLGVLAVGQEAAVTVRSYSDKIFRGKIIKISPVLDPITRMVTVEVLLPNPEHLLKPGMYAEAEITTGIIENTLVLPRYAVRESTSMQKINGRDQVVKTYYVYIVNDSSKAEMRELEVDYVNHVSISVKGGVRPGEKLVITGQNQLRDGMDVLAAENEEAE